MTRGQAKEAYQLAYKTALGLITMNSTPKRLEPFYAESLKKLGLTEEESKRIWNEARSDLARRFEYWRDDAVDRDAEECAKRFISGYF